MANLIQIKRSTVTAVPGSLANGELAYTANGDALYIGSNGFVVPIGGKRNPGILTANQAIVTNATSGIDNLITGKLTIGSANVTVINTVANSTVLGAASNAEITSTWAIKTYVDNKVAGAAGSPGGSNTYLQFNDSGTFSGVAGLTFDKTANSISVGNSTVNATINSTSFSQTANNATNLGGVAAASYALLGGSGTYTGNNTLAGTNTVVSSNLTISGANLNITSSNTNITGKINAVDLVLTGNLTVQGTMTSVDASNLQVKDPIIKLADQNLTTDTLSIGFYGAFGNSTVTQFAGLFRDQSDAGVFKLFSTQLEPGSTVNTANNTYAAGTLKALLAAGGPGFAAFVANNTVVNITANSTVSSALVANTLSLSTALPGTSGGTGLSTIASQSILVGNSTNGFTALAAGADGTILQVSGTTLTYSSLDGGTF